MYLCVYYLGLLDNIFILVRIEIIFSIKLILQEIIVLQSIKR